MKVLKFAYLCCVGMAAILKNSDAVIFSRSGASKEDRMLFGFFDCAPRIINIYLRVNERFPKVYRISVFLVHACLFDVRTPCVIPYNFFFVLHVTAAKWVRALKTSHGISEQRELVGTTIFLYWNNSVSIQWCDLKFPRFVFILQNEESHKRTFSFWRQFPKGHLYYISF